MDFPPFPGFRPQAFEFLRGLAQNNDRDWFKPRKPIYDDEIVWPMQCLVSDSARRLAERRIPLTGDPKRALFRIYRDTRFSKDKRPYKNHAGAVLSPSGGREDSGVLYIHLQPGECFIGAGFWELDSALLSRWRSRMREDPDGFVEMAQGLEARGFTFWTENQLKRLPQGFQDFAEHPVADYLRLKSLAVMRPVSDEAMQQPDFPDHIVETAQEVRPLLEFGWTLGGQPVR